MAIRERPLTDGIVASLPGAAREGASLAGVTADSPPARIVEAINSIVDRPPKKSWFRKVDNWNDRAMPLGALWGTQLVRQYGWEWIIVDDDEDDSSGVGVFDRQRSMGLYPFGYIFGCLEAQACPTILLAWNMLVEGALPDFDSRSYTDIMSGIRHIVPPR